jgi:hypothetical protein
VIVTLFRGVNAADADSAIAALRRGEVAVPNRSWTLWDLRPHARAILSAPETFDDVSHSSRMYPITWACGDLGGAAFYACRGKGVPLTVQ